MKGAQIARRGDSVRSSGVLTGLRHRRADLGGAHGSAPRVAFAGRGMIARAAFTIAAAALTGLPAVAGAQTTFTWTSGSSGNWGDTTRWSGANVGAGAGNIADFSTLNITSHLTVTLEASRTIGAVRFRDNTTASHNWTVAASGSNSLTLDNGASQPVIEVLNQALTTTAPLAGTNGFRKIGAGALFVSNANPGLGGNIRVEQGDVTATVSNPFGTGTITFNGSAGSVSTRLFLNSGVTVSNPLVIDFSSVAIGNNGVLITNASNSATFSGPLTINATALTGGHVAGSLGPSNFLNFTGPITNTLPANFVSGGSGNAFMVRNGNVRLSGGGSYFRVDIRAGILQLGANNGVATNAIVNLGGNGNSTFDLAGFSQSLVGVTNLVGSNSNVITSSSTTSASTLTFNADAANAVPEYRTIAFSGAITDASAAAPLGLNINATSSIGRVTLTSAASSYRGPTVIGGWLTVSSLNNGGANSSIGASTAVASNLVLNGGTLTYTGGTVNSNRAFTLGNAATSQIDVNNAAATVSFTGGAPDASTGSLVKGGAGVLALGGTYAYSGTTTVNAGVLLMNGSHTTAGAYTASGGGIGGSGTLGTAAVSITSGTLYAGSGAGNAANVGTLTTGPLTVSGSVMHFDLANTSPIGGTTNDHVVVNGDLDLSGGGVSVQVNPYQGTLASGEYGLIRYTGNFLGDASAVNLLGVSNNPRQTFSIASGAIDTSNYLKLVVTGNPANLTWNGGNGNNNWDTSTQNWQRVTAFDEIYFPGDIVTFDDTSANTTVAVVGTVSPGSVTVNTTSTYTFNDGGSAALAGTGSLTKSGAGTLVLNISSTYTGNTTVSGGVLEISGNGTLASGVIVNNGLIRFSRAATLSQVVSGTGGLEFSTGDSVISAPGTFDGPVTISGGRIFPTNANAFGSSASGITLSASGQLYPTAANLTYNESLTFAGGTLRTGGTRTSTFTGAVNITVDNPGEISNDANSRLNLNGPVTGDFDLNITGLGFTSFGGDVNLGAGKVIANTGNVIVAPPVGLTTTFNSPISGTGGIAFNGAGTAVMNGTLTAAAAVSFAGTGLYILNTSNALTGSIAVNDASVVRLAVNDALGGTSIVTFAGQAPVAGNVALGGDITVANPLLLLGRTGNSPYFINTAGTNTVAGTMNTDVGGTNYNFRSDAGLLRVTGTYTQIGGGSTRTIQLMGDGDGEFASSPALSGAGTNALIGITKSGLGTWTMTGSLASMAGPLRANAGHLIVTQAVPSSIPALSAGSSGQSGRLTLTVAGSNASNVVVASVGTVSVTGGGTLAIAPADRTPGGAAMKAKLLIVGNTPDLGYDGTSAFAGSIDLGNGDAIIRNGDLNLVRLAVRGWIAGGNGIKATGSSVADPRDAYATLGVRAAGSAFGFADFTDFDGQSVAATDLLVKYTYHGDTDLNGLLDARDYNSLLNGWSNGLTGWQNGDVNYDGLVDASDFSLFLSAYTNQGAPFTGGSEGGASIPEPSAVGLLACGLPLLTRRRRTAN